MNRNSFYKASIIGLLIANLLLIGFLLFDKKPHRHTSPKDRPRNHIIEKLALDKDQVEQYDELIHNHRSKIKQLDRELLIAKRNFYTSLGEKMATPNDSLISKISTWQMEIEKVHFAHFEDIKALCREDQKDAYYELIHELAQLFNHKPPH